MKPVRVAVVAPARRLTPEMEATVREILATSGLADRLDLLVHPQCFLDHGHFAGPDEARRAAFLEVANDPGFDAVWFARGGYGSGRLLPGLADDLAAAARDKIYLGYSDLGFLLAGLTRAGCRWCAHGPMLGDAVRAGSQATVARSLAFLAGNLGDALEPSLADSGDLHLAFNLSILRSLLATPWLPDSTGAVLMVEDVGEYAYATDRAMLQLASSDWFGRLAGVRIGRFGAVQENDVPFPLTSEAAVAHWCARAGVPVLGSADIGHDNANCIVPWGRLCDWRSRCG